MSSVFGERIKVSIFGQSHSKSIGVTIDGLPAGERIDFEELQTFLERRAPGRDRYSTPRREADKPVFLSGFVDDVLCGAPVTAVIENGNTRSQDYDKLRDVPRPGHADYTAWVKYGAAHDIAGGGHFSGRLTAPLCIAGGMCKQLLRKKGIRINAHIYGIGGIHDTPYAYSCDDETAYHDKCDAMTGFPVLDAAAGEKMCELIESVRLQKDSVGGMIECVISGMPAGVGEPMFGGVENRISQAVFGVPAIKGIEFGNGFECAGLRGSQNNDAFFIKEQGGERLPATLTDNHGGILGGITSGMPIVFRVAVKPTPSIGIPQKSISLSKMENTELEIVGRHDPCIVQRAVPCIEAAAAVALYDLLNNC